jgi:hypothetical protein
MHVKQNIKEKPTMVTCKTSSFFQNKTGLKVQKVILRAYI